MTNSYKFFQLKPFIIILALLLGGCVSDLFVANEPILPETVAELAVRGASLCTTDYRHKPLPQDIGAHLFPENPEMVYSGELDVLIFPNAFVKNRRNDGRFFYAFSKHLGDDVYELLLNQRFDVDNVPIRTFIELYVADGLLPGMESLSELSDFYLHDSVFFLPANATHMELHFLPDDIPDGEPMFVERWELSGFYGYDRYMAPLIAGMKQ